MLFCIFTHCMAVTVVNFRTFSSAQKKPYTPLRPSPAPCIAPQLLALLIYCLSPEMSILDISYKWNRAICGFLCPAVFPPHYISRVHLCCSMGLPLVPFHGWIIFHCMDRPQTIHSPVDVHLACFHSLVLCVICCDPLCTRFRVDRCFHFSWLYTWEYRVTTAESGGNSVSNSLRNCRSILYCGHTIFHSQHQSMRIPIPP